MVGGTSQLVAVTFDARDPDGLGRFWGRLLGREAAEGTIVDVVLRPNDDSEFLVCFMRNDTPKVGQNRMHFDLTSATPEEQQATVERGLELGARHIDIGQTPDEGHVVLGDPEGNEFCVIEAGNDFLADTAFIGAINCDGSQEVGYFWSKALGWPLVWDQDGETAIQSPRGGTKIAWGGLPVAPKTGKERLHLDIAPPVGADHQVEVERLIALGARRTDIGQGDVPWEVMADPDGNEFCVLTPR
jgi:catechol 2,3-dioxygenase-like lactoylglutathione lyase family enzyme